MSSLTTNDKQVLEKLFSMSSGYVLNFSDRTFKDFFWNDLQIDIYAIKYNYASGSKANRMRCFWNVSSDVLVGKLIEELLSYLKTQILIGALKREDFSEELIERARDIIARLQGSTTSVRPVTENEFVEKEFGNLSIDKLNLDTAITGILKQRIDEIKKCLPNKAVMAVIFLCGSTLEGILLGIALTKSRDFNQSTLSPKDKAGKVKQFYDWTLNNFIDVARDLNLVGEDVKKFSHALRDFRNYIHPYQQMSSSFNPDEHTAKICWQVLQAAIMQLSNK